MPASYKKLVLVAVAAVAIGAMFLVDPIPQDPAYHDFADSRTLLGVPNFWNVATNIPFLLIGAAALVRARRLASSALHIHFMVYCIAIALVAFGSSYYHYAPSNASLVWDRLPMTVAFMALLAAVIADRLSWFAGRALLGPLVVAGIGSIAWWVRTETVGLGDLRPYAIVQFLPGLLIPLMLLFFRGDGLRDRWLWSAIAAYALAKLVEHFDGPIFDAGRIMGGHALKHVLAAVAAWWLVRAFRTPRQISPASAL